MRVVHFAQIWIVPSVRGINPEHEQTRFLAAGKRGRLRLVASPDRRDGSVTMHQDAVVYAALVDGAESAVHALAPGRRADVHAARGSIRVNRTPLLAGDAAKITGESVITLDEGVGAEVLLFDLG